MAGVQSHVISPSRAHLLATSNLLRIFSNRDERSRLAAMSSTYHPDITIYEPDNKVLRGFEQISETITDLLARPGSTDWEFVATGEVKYNTHFVGVTWGFGPRGEDGKVIVKGTGADVILVEKDDSDGEVKIKTLYVIIDGLADAKA